jgi:hypothetical protein
MLRPSFLPGLWERIKSMIVDGSIRSVDEVEPELSQKDDEIRRWAKAQSELFVPIDQDVERETRTSLAAHPRLIGIGSGRSGADPFVIALASARGGVVVTEEPRKSIARPKIPDVCDAVGVRCIGLVDFVEEQGWTFR